MANEWILNQANMRWGLTKKNKVGPVSELITRSIKEIALARFEGTARRAPTVQKGQLVFRSE